MDKKNCMGCYNDDYNYGMGGAKECLYFRDATVIMRKEVHVDQRPPWNQPARKFPSCYTKRRYVYVDPNAIN